VSGFFALELAFNFSTLFIANSQVRQAILEQRGQWRAFGLRGLVLWVTAAPDLGWLLIGV
jgi:hypothetical protein